ncbi:MAG: transporter substrate-binding domain-containing protein [Xanthobacteraceae bacterium]
MKLLSVAFASFLAIAAAPAAAQNIIAPTGTLRAVYLGSNPAQAQRDPETKQLRGASYVIARDLALTYGLPLVFSPSPNPAAVIESVAKGDADIGFVAYAPSRTGTVEFSQTYMVVGQSFVVAEDSPIRTVADIDQAERKIGGGKGDSITLFLARALKQAKLVETDNTPAQAKQMLSAHEIDAFGANRQRLLNLLKEMPGYRILPDNIFDVPQTVIVGKGKVFALAAVNRFIDEARTSGLLQQAIDDTNIPGLSVAPKSYGYGKAEEK